jgi:hypothetical protein
MVAKSKDPSQAPRLAYDSNHNTTHYNDASYRRFPELSTDCSETQYLLNTIKSKKQLLTPGLNFDEEFQKPVQLLNFTHYGALPELGYSAGMHIVAAHIPELSNSSPLTDPSQAQRFPREVRMYKRTHQARPIITAMPGVLYNELSSSESKTALSSCPVHDDSPLTVVPMNEDFYQARPNINTRPGLRYNKVSTLESKTALSSCPVHDMIEAPYQLARESPYYKASYMFTVHLSLNKPDHKDLHKTLSKSRMGKYTMMNKFHSKTKITLVMKFKMTLF